MTTRARWVSLVAGATSVLAGAALLAPGGSAQAGEIPFGTLVVSKTEIAEGETITVSNADEDASRCEGGLVVVFVGGAPAGINQLVVEPDVNGDWELEWTGPLAADYPSQSVLGPYEFSGLCDELPVEDQAAPAAAPPFEYGPVTVTVVQQEEPPAEAPSEPEAPAAAPVVAQPTVTG